MAEPDESRAVQELAESVPVSRSRRRLDCFTVVPSGFSFPIAMFFSLRSLRRMVEFHRFLIALSVLPGTILAISAHLLP